MKQTLFQDKYPVFTLELGKDETSFADVDAIVAELKQRIGEDDRLHLIGEFDHFAHTRKIGGTIGADIRAAKNLLFCFGLHLPNPQVLAVRPRSIGVVDCGDRFVISFLEAPMQAANEKMEGWVRALRNR